MLHAYLIQDKDEQLVKDRISDIEDRIVEINESEKKKGKLIKINEDNLRDLQDSVKCPNIQIIGVSEEDKRPWENT